MLQTMLLISQRHFQPLTFLFLLLHKPRQQSDQELS